MTVRQFEELVAPQTWRTVDFISDLHLSVDEPATFEAWERYLTSTTADAVFMLGDLFEVWVGDDVLDTGGPTGFEARCAALLAQASTRFALFFMHGNRDFLLGQAMADRCHATTLSDPTVLEFSSADGSRWLLSHGDALCLLDTDYMRFRAQVRTDEWQLAFLAKPLAERQAVARSIRQQSQARKASESGYADVDTNAALQWLELARASTLIHGHTHNPARHDLGDGRARVVLSDWHADAVPARGDVLRLSANGLKRIDWSGGSR